MRLSALLCLVSLEVLAQPALYRPPPVRAPVETVFREPTLRGRQPRPTTSTRYGPFNPTVSPQPVEPRELPPTKDEGLWAAKESVDYNNPPLFGLPDPGLRSLPLDYRPDCQGHVFKAWANMDGLYHSLMGNHLAAKSLVREQDLRCLAARLYGHCYEAWLGEEAASGQWAFAEWEREILSSLPTRKVVLLEELHKWVFSRCAGVRFPYAMTMAESGWSSTFRKMQLGQEPF